MFKDYYQETTNDVHFAYIKDLRERVEKLEDVNPSGDMADRLKSLLDHLSLEIIEGPKYVVREKSKPKKAR